jgi:hypothetical protein
MGLTSVAPVFFMGPFYLLAEIEAFNDMSLPAGMRRGIVRMCRNTLVDTSVLLRHEVLVT